MGKAQAANLVLKKHIATIHCANTLTLLQRKISNALLYSAYDQLLINEVHQIGIKELCGLIGYQGHNYAAIKDALRQLVSTRIEWNLIDDTDEEEWTASSILASVKLKGAQCFYAYSPHMKQLLHLPQIYGIINLSVQAKFKSAYALALYENVARYKNLSFTKWFDLDLFRQLMGVPDEQYVQFRDFKRRVLLQSIKEVNAYSEINIESEIKRCGRAVKAIRFKIDSVPNAEKEKKKEEGGALLLIATESLQSKLSQQYGLTQLQVKKLIKTYNEAQILEKITLIEASDSYRKGQIKNMAAFLMQSLKNDYKTPVSSQQLTEKKRREKDVEIQIDRAEESKKQAKEMDYDNYLNAIIKDYLGGLTVDEFVALEQGFKQQLIDEKNTAVLKFYKQKGLKHILVQSMFYRYVRMIVPGVLQNALGFDAYVCSGESIEI